MVRELIKRTASRLYVGLWASAEYVVNLLLWSTYKFKRGARLGLNQLKALIVRSYRVVVHVAWLVAAWLRSFGTALRKAVTVAIRCCTETAVLVGLPLALLAAAAWLATAAAEETRRYLTDGALAALAELSGLDMLAIALATCAWTSLAGLPRLRESAGSALESATITGSYALLLIAFGGWLVGLPGTFGYGVIHVGWVTMGSTVALAAAFLLPQRRHEVPEGITTAGA